MKTILSAAAAAIAAFAALALTAPAGEAPRAVVVRPEAAPGPLDNPLKGWCPYTDAGPIRQPYSMVYLSASWKELEPGEGKYDFDGWEKRAWSAKEAKGKHVVFRITIDTPKRPSGLPGWLKDKGVKLTPYKDHGGGLSPDYDDERLVAGLEKLIAALGNRYDGNPRVAFVQLGLLGFWGEWHTWPQDKLFAGAKTQRRVIDAYHKAFPTRQLMARTANGHAGKQDWLGFHDDMFPEDTDNGEDWSFLAVLRAAKRADNWKVAAVGGEMVPEQAAKWVGKERARTLKTAETAHFSRVGPYCPALAAPGDKDFLKNSEELVRRLGYQFRLTEVRHPAAVPAGGKLAVKLSGTNEGVAPFYYPWRVELALLDDKGKEAARLPLKADVRRWLPGDFSVEESVTVKAPKGHYRLALGVRDPWSDRPAVGFANKLRRTGGWTELSAVDVTE